MKDRFGRELTTGMYVAIERTRRHGLELGKIERTYSNRAVVVFSSGNKKTCTSGTNVVRIDARDTEELTSKIDSIEATAAKHSAPPIPMKDLIPGRIYEDYNNGEYLYLGKGTVTRHSRLPSSFRFTNEWSERIAKTGHIFMYTYNNHDIDDPDNYLNVQVVQSKKLLSCIKKTSSALVSRVITKEANKRNNDRSYEYHIITIEDPC